MMTIHRPVGRVGRVGRSHRRGHYVPQRRHVQRRSAGFS